MSRVRRLLAACAGLAATAAATAAERIYESRSSAGLPVYSNAPREGATLLMTLSPAPARAAILDARPRRTSDAGEPTDSAVHSLVRQAARRHALDAELLLAVIRQESGFDPQAVSRAGARGLMQLMPATAQRYGVTRIHDPGQNIAAGSAYLRDLLDRFGRLDLALAAYNAGENAVEKYGRRVPPFSETQQYVQAVLSDYRARKSSLR